MLYWKVALKGVVDPAISALVSDGLLYRTPQAVRTPPVVTYFIVSDVSALETGPQEVLFQIDIFHTSDLIAEQIREAIRGVLHDQPFTIIGAAHHFLKEINKREEAYDSDIEGFHFIMEFRSIYHRE